jgi:hypothetical protein
MAPLKCAWRSGSGRVAQRQCEPRSQRQAGPHSHAHAVLRRRSIVRRSTKPASAKGGAHPSSLMSCASSCIPPSRPLDAPTPGKGGGGGGSGGGGGGTCRCIVVLSYDGWALANGMPLSMCSAIRGSGVTCDGADACMHSCMPCQVMGSLPTSHVHCPAVAQAPTCNPKLADRSANLKLADCCWLRG